MQGGVAATTNPKTPSENVATRGNSKKKSPRNGAQKSTTSKKGNTKTIKKRKPPTSKAGKEIHEVSDVELQADLQLKAAPQRIQVKQRSTGGNSTIAAGDAASDFEATPAVGDAGKLATGHYGMLLETKRAEKLCLSLTLQKRHMEALHRAFKREEQLGTGEITTGEFFTTLHEQPRQLTKGLFENVGLARDIKRLRFDDFVLCVLSIATWSKSELLHYAFKQFDIDESGLMDSHELQAFCEGLKNDGSFYFAKNVNTAREKLASRDRKNLTNQHSSGQLQIDNDSKASTLVDLEDLMKGSTEFQVAFYPLMQLQQNVRACALGEQFWAGATQRRQHVEVVVQHMGLHKGKLPPIPFVTRIIAYLIPFSQAHAKVLVHKLAVLKYAEEERQQQEQTQARAHAKQVLRLGQVQEEN